MELFLHPWYMVAGGALVSAPIIIHLINRMRFKRIRWAAMEFLLKSQKRNRRRLIIEQMILLALRCLLVLLAGFLVARYVMAKTSQAGTDHILILDDTASMADRWAGGGGMMNAFEQGKLEIRKMAKDAAQANSVQRLRVMLLSDLDTLVFDNQLNDRTIEELTTTLKDKRPTALHIDPIAGIQKAEALFTESAQKQKVLHLVSDFRERDWVSGPGVEALNKAVDALLEKGINLSLIDCAHPFRKETRDVAIDHGNLAIVDFRAESRVAAEGVPVEFTLTIENFSTSEKKTFLHVKKDGVEDFTASQPIESLPALQKTEKKFQLIFAKKNKAAADLKDSDSKEERERKRLAEREFVQITAELDSEETGLQLDNVRDLVIEVRKKVPALVVDGGGPESRGFNGDLFHLDVAFSAARSYEIERRTVEELEKTNLDIYPSIFLLNVAEIKNEKIIDKLQDYVKKGGSICFCMGDKVKPSFYNEVLNKKYEGLFPVLFGPRPFNPIDPNGTMTDEEKAERRKERLNVDKQPKILFRNPNHPVVAGMYPIRNVFQYLGIDLYYKTLPRFQWDPEPRQCEDIILLPNSNSIDDYKQRAQELGNKAVELTKDLASEDKVFEKYKTIVENYRRDISQALSSPFLFNLVTTLDALLRDPGIKDDPAKPNMPELWAHPRMRALASEIREFADTLLYGDPLLVARPYGKGRTVAFLTTIGTATKWNNWGGGSPASWTYPMFIMDLQRFLTSQGDDLNRVVGTALKQELDPALYKSEVRITFQPQPDLDPKEGQPRPATLQEIGTQPLPLNNNVLSFAFNATQKPGVYTFAFFPQAANAVEPPPEIQSYAFNVDASAESNLRRAAKDKLERNKPVGAESQVGKIALRSPGDDYAAFKNKQPDASESPWLYVFILLILVVEQALAVHLSFHLKGNELVPAAAKPQAAAA